MGLEQRLRLVARQRLDPEWAGDREQRALQAVVRERFGAGDGIVIGELEAVVGLAMQTQDPAAARTTRERRPAPRRARRSRRASWRARCAVCVQRATILAAAAADRRVRPAAS